MVAALLVMTTSTVGARPSHAHLEVSNIALEVTGERQSHAAISPQQTVMGLERKNRELQSANEILRKASAYFA